jgi:hypothetical protein
MSIENITLSGGSGIPAVGTILSVLTQTSPGDYLAIGNMGNIDWPLSRATADTTNQGTPWKQSVGTLFTGGDISAEFHYVPGSAGIDPSGAFGHGFASGLGYLFTQLNTLLNFSITGPGGQQIFFTGHITKFPLAFDLTKDIMVKMTIEVSGQPVFSGF